MRVTVDTKRCIGSGECVATAPEVFLQNESEGYAETYRDLSDAQREAARRAVIGCPVQAIQLDWATEETRIHSLGIARSPQRS